MADPPSEPVRCQLRTTKVLRPDRCVMPDGNCCSACTEDIALEQQLKELKKLMENIHIKRRALRTVMNQNHDRLIHRFPPEIASRIFFYYSPITGFLETYAKTNTLFLGAICQKWRQLAWATPEVWTWIYINHKLIYRWNSNAAKLLAEWLERSATLPLTIRFLGPSNGDSAVYCVVTDLLNKHLSRWYDIELDIPAHHFHRLGGSSQQNILHKLGILPSIGSNQPLSMFRMECSPIELGLMYWSLKYVDILWNNLTALHLASLALDEFFEALRRAPHLATITLLGIEPLSGNFGVPNIRISCPHVRSLELGSIESEVLGQILNLVCLPSLEQWTLYWCLFPLNTMISFIESSSFGLKTFRITGDHDIRDQIHDLLRRLPSIEVLQLGFIFEDKPPTAILFFELLCSSSETSFLPHLQTLRFDHDLLVPLESLPRIFSASHRQSLQLEVDYHNILDVEDETAARLLELVDKGFNLRVLRDGEVDMIEEYRLKRYFQRKEGSQGSIAQE
jgi:hypothetical protein